METVDAAVVLYPRFTTLVGSVTAQSSYDFPTAPLDVSRHSGIQFQLWTGAFSGGSGQIYLEESLDGETWVLGPGAASGVALLGNDNRFFSYSFRLRWFRVRIALTGAASPIVTCWAAGLLRGGGSGVWPVDRPTGGALSSRAAGAVMPPAFTKGLPGAGGAPGVASPGKGDADGAAPITPDERMSALLARVAQMDTASIDNFLRLASKAGK